MATAYVVTTNGELYHYGVKGMKWGVRNASDYTARSNYHASKIATSKTRIGKNYHNFRAYRNEVKAGDRKARDEFAKNKSLRGTIRDIDNVWGHGATARSQSAASKYYDRKSTYTKTRLGTTMTKAHAYNNKTAAAANTRLHNAKNLKEYGTNFVNAVANRSIKTWSGRTTTTGKRYVDEMLTGGMIGGMADIAYYTKGKK